MKKIFIDSDLFIRDLRYHRDVHSQSNQRFLDNVRTQKIRGVTSIFNLLEVCGILSFNLSQKELLDLYADFCQHYQVQILFPADAQGNLQYEVEKIFEIIQIKQSLGDAQISYVVERFTDKLFGFVSWNAPHFVGKLNLPVMTPKEYLDGI